MNKLTKYSHLIIPIVLSVIFLSSCKKFFDPKQELNDTESQLYGDWYEYRSAAMGLYGLQQKLVEQLLILGELRGDLLKVTPNADADMIEIYNFNISKNNKYASPTNFFKLISACNNFIRIVKSKHPEVLDPNVAVTNYDRIYGEALCMRAWAYFNAARIYGKVPYIHEELTTIDEIEKYVNSSGTYVDSVYINFSIDGYHNDTIRNNPITLEKQVYDLPTVIDVFTNQLEKEVKAVGVDYAIDNGDNTWEVTTWHPFAMHALLGQMYLTQGNYVKAHDQFLSIMVNNTTGTTSARYDLNRSFSYTSWQNIFTSIDFREHIYSIWFNKTYFQQNQLQDFFVNKYMLKPTHAAISKWESCRINQVIVRNDSRPELSYMSDVGLPIGDYFRGYLTSYVYKKNGGGIISQEDYFKMRTLTSKLDFRSANSIMDGTDTVVNKYTINKNVFEKDSTKLLNSDVFTKDPEFIIYRAAGIHLYMAEIYVYWTKIQDNGLLSTDQRKVLGIVNDGSFYNVSASRTQLGVRGRVYLGSGYDGINSDNILYIHDPYSNEIIGYKDIGSDLQAKQDHLEDEILNERALELAFEGERFYDLMRFAKRRNDPSFLAKIVSAKYPAGQREAIYNYLLDENNWYIKYFQ